MVEKTYLKILDIQPGETKKKYLYKNILFEEIVFNGTKEFSSGKQSKRIFWKGRQITIQEKNSNTIQTINSKGDMLYNTAVVGGYCIGKIVELQTTPYRTNKLENIFLCVILDNEYSNILKEAARQLHFYKALPLDANGKPYKYIKNYYEVEPVSYLESDDELEYLKGEYEEDSYDFLSGGESFDEFNGDWDGLYASNGLD